MCIRDSPIACSAIPNDFYVDDLMTGSDNPHILSKMKSNITDLLSQYGFTLHKWFSNDQTIIASHGNSSLNFSKNQTVRTLGIQWDIDEDVSYIVSKDMSKWRYSTREGYYLLSQEFTTLWDSLAQLHSGVSILYRYCG